MRTEENHSNKRLINNHIKCGAITTEHNKEE